MHKVPWTLPVDWFDQHYVMHYIAGLFAPFKQSFFDRIVQGTPPPGALISFVTATHYDGKDGMPGRRLSIYQPLLERVRDLGGITMLDSGAFTAWSKGYDVNIEQYAQFCIAYCDLFKVAVNLDVIGDSENTLKNLKYLEDRGITDYIYLLPVFQFGTSLDELHKLAERYEYIGIGGIARMEGDKRRSWLRRIAQEKLPTKFHLFGVLTSEEISIMKPLSVDNASWSVDSSLGKVTTKDGSWMLGRRNDNILSPAIIRYLTKKAEQFELTYEELLTPTGCATFNWFSHIEIMQAVEYVDVSVRKTIF